MPREFRTILVLCPCGTKCKGYSSDPDEPNRCSYAYESRSLPNQFLGREPTLWEKIKIGAIRFAADYVFVVYECPHCRCEVLLGYERDDASNIVEEFLGALFKDKPKLEKLAERSRC